MSNTKYVSCVECGACVPRNEIDEHDCDSDRWLDYQLVRLRPRIYCFEADYRAWLEGKEGMFEVFYAERTRPPHYGFH